MPVNPDKCKANNQPYYVNNDRVADYNAIYPKLAEEERVVFLDVASALSDETASCLPTPRWTACTSPKTTIRPGWPS